MIPFIPSQIFNPISKPVACLLAGMLVLGVFAGLALDTKPAHASPHDLKRHTFILGLKDSAYRTKEGAKDLRERIRERLRAARLLDYTLSVDRDRHELTVQVTTSMAHAQLKSLLLARGEVQVLPMAISASALAGLEGVLPESVSWNEEILERSRVDGYLHSPNGEGLSTFAAKLVLTEFDVYVAPVMFSDQVTGFRTGLVKKSAPTLGSDGLAEVTIHTSTYPNYYYLKVYWSDASVIKAHKGRELGGASGLFTVTGAANGTRVLVLLDGKAVGAVNTPEAIDNGRLIIRLPRSDKDSQRDMARQLAGRMASGAHPCPIVVISSEVVSH